MRVAIVDDEQEVRDQLTQYIRQFSEDSGVELETIPFSSGDAILQNYAMNYDIIIFDIDMPGRNGMDTAREIRKTDQNVTIIFMTNIAQYAINGYEVDAVDYIIKPIGYYDFSMKFHRTVSKAMQRVDHIIKIDTADGIYRVRMAAILYAEVQSHYLYFHTRKNVYKSRGNIQDAMNELAPYGFVQTHRSYIVNLKYVDRIKSSEIVVAGESIPVGRSYKDDVRQRYMQYVRGTE